MWHYMNFLELAETGENIQIALNLIIQCNTGYLNDCLP